MYDLENEELVIDEMPEKNRHRQMRRHNNVCKALRKRDMSRHTYGFDWYNNLHQYSKNKIHCSCGMCRFRSAYDPDNKPVSDVRRINAMNAELKEYMKSA